MNLAGLDLATTSGLTAIKDRVYETTTFRANVKKSILDDAKLLDAKREGEIGRKFEDFLTFWLIDNKIDRVAIEAPIVSNNTRRKRTINTDAGFAGQAISYEEVAGTSMAAIFRIYGLEFIALAVCNRLNIPAVFVAQGTWRKEFLGNGRPADAKKEAVRMCSKLGIEVSSVDAAESVGVAFWLERQVDPYSHRRANDLFAPKTISAKDYRAEAEKHFKTAG